MMSKLKTNDLGVRKVGLPPLVHFIQANKNLKWSAAGKYPADVQAAKARRQ